MKLNYRKIILFIVILIFFIPDGMITVGNLDYLQNSAFLNSGFTVRLVTFILWARNVIGIAACVWCILLKFHTGLEQKIYLKATMINTYALFAIWVLIGVNLNSMESYQALIHLSYCMGYLIITEKCIKCRHSYFLNILSLVMRLLLFTNLILLLCYPYGITTGKDYLSTAYYFLGTKNQTTPLLILASMLFFMEYKRKKGMLQLIASQTIVLLNALIMGSGTGIICVAIVLAGNMLQIKKNNSFSFKSENMRKSKANYVLWGAVIVSLGIVFFNFQRIFSWLIVDVLNKDLSLSGRTATWSLAIEQFLTKPIVGYGYGHMTIGHYYAHNAILEVLVTTGVIGLLMYFIFLKTVFKGHFDYSGAL